MQVMQSYQDRLEKERDNERQHRLKLEEEYMTVTKNLEEEVTLRLQFESNLNKLSNQHREVQIDLTRTKQQLGV